MNERATDRVDAEAEQRWNEQAMAEPVLQPEIRFWQYSTPAIVLGRSQRALHRGLPVDVSPLRFVDRAAGGGAVLVGPWMLGASFVLPVDDPRVSGASVADSYRWLGAAFVGALSTRGIQAESVPRERTRAAPAHLAWACFAGTAPWELEAANRKIVGFAQRRTRNGVLIVAGALLSPVPWRRLTDAMARPAGEATELAESTIDAMTLSAAPLPADELADAVRAELLRAELVRNAGGNGSAVQGEGRAR